VGITHNKCQRSENTTGELMSEDETEKKAQPKLPMIAQDVMIREVVTLDVNVTAKKAAEIMAQEGISALITIAEGKAVERPWEF